MGPPAKRGALNVIAALYKDDGAGCDLNFWNVSLEFDGYWADVNSVWGLGYV